MKKKVALLANGWNGENLDNFINGFTGKFADQEMDLFVFTSYSLSSQNVAERDAEDSIYSLPDFSFFDMVIVFGSGINSNLLIDQIIEKCQKVDVPVILQGSEMDGITSVTVDNYVGMRDLCEHLISQHNVKDVVFIAGNSDNSDSNFRLNVVKDTLNAHGYELEKENIYYANWEPTYIHTYIKNTYGDGKKKLPDAFICANDQMAIFVMVFLEQIGVNLPDDVIVTGFDNLHAGRVYYPSLATVDQSYFEQGTECAKLFLDMQQDSKIVKKSIIPCVASFGESCGCMNCKNEIELRKQIGRNVWSNQYTDDHMSGREAHMDMCIMSNSQFDKIQDSIYKDVFATSGVETDDFHIYLNSEYKNLAYMDGTGNTDSTDIFSQVLDVLAAKSDGELYIQSTMDISQLLLGYKEDGKSKTYIFKSLKVDNSTVGYMVMGYTDGSFESRKYIDFSSSLNKTLKKFQRNIDDFNRAIRIQEQANIFLRQTVEALASAVDAKDSYTHGHSARVAKYARKIAQVAGMTEEECDDIYLAGLLHDIGKIGIKDDIINKKGKLTTDEFSAIKQHPVLGDEILAKIEMSPVLRVGAKHHHERYDGKGYPDRLKGENIPQIARIIAVADAYDAMTSKRSYRDLIPQMYVREELVKGIGSQFDPTYAKIMIHLLDLDEKYEMREQQTEIVFEPHTTYLFDYYRTIASPGIHITDCPISINITYKALKDGGMPTLLLYDSADAKFYLEENSLSEEMDFIEFGSVDLNGDIATDFIKKMQRKATDLKKIKTVSGKVYDATITLIKQEDHLLIQMKTQEYEDEIIFALYDASRFIYLAFTGDHCRLDVLDVEVAENPVEKDYIPRIAEKVSFIDGPVGDIPNVQIDGWRADHSEVIEITKQMDIRFHTKSLPSSRRIWHCPIICLFISDDGTIDGPNYQELALARLDGEVWNEDEEIINSNSISTGDDFGNWSIWKQKNKAGVDCEVSLSHQKDVVYLKAEISGLKLENETKLPENIEKVYCFITGDQCAITDIHIV